MKSYNLFIIFAISILCMIQLCGSVLAEPACYVYCSNYYSNTITIIDPATYEKVAEIITDKNPSDVIVNPAGTYLYVAYDGSAYVDEYSTIDYTRTSRIKVSDNDTVQVTRMCMNDEGTRLYLTMVSDGSVYSVDILNKKVLEQEFIPGLGLTSGQPYGIVYYKDYLYVNLYADNYVVKLDPATLDTIKTYGTPDFISNYEFNAPMDIVADSYNNRLLVNNINDTTTIINIGTDSVTGILKGSTMGNNGNGIAINSTGYAYRSDSGAANISIFNTTTKVGYINVPGSKPLGIVANNYNNTVFFADRNNNRLYVINTDSVLGYIQVGNGPYRLTIGTQANEAQHQVKFVVQSLFGVIKYENVAITVYDENDVLQYSQQTDQSGQVAFYLSQTKKYTVTAYSTADSINETITIVPYDDTYYFNVWSFFTDWNPFGWVQGINADGNGTGYVSKDIQINYSVNTSLSPRVITINYSDVTATTSAVNFTLLRHWQENGTYTVYNTTIVSAAGISYQQMPINVTEADADGNSYQIVVTAETGDYGTVKRMDTYHFPGVSYPLPGLPSSWYMYVAFGFIVLIGLFFTYFSTGLGLLVMAFLGTMFMFMGWIAWSESYLLLLQILAIFGVGHIFKMKRQREGV